MVYMKYAERQHEPYFTPLLRVTRPLNSVALMLRYALFTDGIVSSHRLGRIGVGSTRFWLDGKTSTHLQKLSENELSTKGTAPICLEYYRALISEF